ncbi:sigma factor-like helix-turn-helix DNA-binding protein [Bacillus altitudinis]|uniref:sigma factor-like helix-turn-helix DNA-binding protein n=1 Tax=Bacillus altitudinis TaxID=293387 RepID=UPI00041BE8CF|nr:sigma factor-like helix-turn-helix DNA-binding protein [Bacillus altitudinis]MDR4197940.1 Fis family transcriptional regulator [Bacillus altitudinis]MED1480756.1 sigma factor-like helix-turn-helix DNA-binding protein [Bacillus altitudinis]
MNELILEYKRALKDTKRRYEQLDETDPSRKIFSAMINDLEYVVKWLSTGRQPEAKRAIDRRSVYQRTVFASPEVLEALANQYNFVKEPPRKLSEDDKRLIEYALSTLTQKQKEMYLSHVADGNSLDKIASLMGVSKGTVQIHLSRAKKKIAIQLDLIRSKGA